MCAGYDATPLIIHEWELIDCEKADLQAPELSSWLLMLLYCQETSEEGQPVAVPERPCPSDRSHTLPVRCSVLESSYHGHNTALFCVDWRLKGIRTALKPQYRVLLGLQAHCATDLYWSLCQSCS